MAPLDADQFSLTWLVEMPTADRLAGAAGGSVGSGSVGVSPRPRNWAVANCVVSPELTAMPKNAVAGMEDRVTVPVCVQFTPSVLR